MRELRTKLRSSHNPFARKREFDAFRRETGIMTWRGLCACAFLWSSCAQSSRTGDGWCQVADGDRSFVSHPLINKESRTGDDRQDHGFVCQMKRGGGFKPSWKAKLMHGWCLIECFKVGDVYFLRLHADTCFLSLCCAITSSCLQHRIRSVTKQNNVYYIWGGENSKWVLIQTASFHPFKGVM